MISRIDRLNQIKKTLRVDAFFISSSSSVKYFSGYYFYFEYGLSPFHLLPAILMAVPSGEVSLLLADNETGQNNFIDKKIQILTYPSYSFEKPPNPVVESIDVLSAFIFRNKLQSARIGIERNAIPFIIINSLNELYPAIQWVDIDEPILQMKLVKDADEIENIRKAAQLADIGQNAVLRFAREGISELELFAFAHRDMEKAVGYRIPLMSDLSSGINTNGGGGMPTNKIIENGDLILSDFQPCLNGYWGDSCNTCVIGEATADQKKTWNFVQEALEIGISSIRPGIRANEIDRLMRKHIGNYPHHSGHSVGTKYHEGPRITPYNSMELRPGMVIALEPAIYKEEYGIRLEHLMFVTDAGVELLTQFNHRIEIN